MKKVFSVFVLALVLVSISVPANAQFSDILNKVTSTASKSSNSTVSSVVNVISSKLVPTSTQIIGTWSYQKPAVMFTSDSSLKSSAAALATSSVEDKMQTYLSKYGVKKGCMSITFKEDKTCTINRNGKTLVSGTYAITNDELSMTFKGKTLPSKITPQLSNGSLVLVGDVSKLKTLLENAGTKLNSTTISALTTLSKSMDGMKLGVRMSK